MSNFRDRIRAKTVAAEKKFKDELVHLKIDGESVDVMVRQPTVEERGLIFDSAGSVDPKTSKVQINAAKLQVNAVMALCRVPDENGKATDEKAFEEADRDSLLAQPAAKGGWFDDLSKVAMDMLNVDLGDAKNA